MGLIASTTYNPSQPKLGSTPHSPLHSPFLLLEVLLPLLTFLLLLPSLPSLLPSPLNLWPLGSLPPYELNIAFRLASDIRGIEAWWW